MLISCTGNKSRPAGAVHCGTAMDLVTPVLAWTRTGYTFEPEGVCRDELPPVWRCQCGFQLDAWLPAAAPAMQVPATSAMSFGPYPG
ncbi:hypothetical protein ARTHROSP310_13370 [Arthrobacter sp. AD-310]